MKTNLLVLGIGELLWDVFPGKRQPGGAPTNVVYHATQLGADARLISRIGKDTDGEDLLAQLSETGINTESVQKDPQHPTGTVTVTIDAQGQPTYTIHEPVAYDFIEVTDDTIALSMNADAVCFGTLAQRGTVSRATIHALVAATPATCLRFFDINLRQHFYDANVLHQSLLVANALKINDEELPILAKLLDITDDSNEESLLAQIASRYELRLVALTKGKNGSVLWTPERVSRHSGYPVEQVVDTVGAGDSFTAAVLLGILRGIDLDIIHDRAARLAAYVCTQTGGTPPLTDELKTALNV